MMFVCFIKNNVLRVNEGEGGGEICPLCNKYICQSGKKPLGAHFVCYKELEEKIFEF